MLALIPLFPLLGFLVNWGFGRRLPKTISGGVATNGTLPSSQAQLCASADAAASVADSKRLLGMRYANWILGAPELEAGIACASMAQDEWGHCRLLYALLRDFGDDVDALEHGVHVRHDVPAAGHDRADRSGRRHGHRRGPGDSRPDSPHQKPVARCDGRNSTGTGRDCPTGRRPARTPPTSGPPPKQILS